MILTLDTRELKAILKEFKSKAPNGVEIISTVMKTFDIATELVGIELKEIGDFISAVINISERKDGTEYERMESQFQRMLEDPRPVKILFIHGSLENSYSNLHPNSFRGMLASYMARGAAANPPVQVIWISEDNFDWVDLVLRLCVKTMKYVEHPSQVTLPIGAE